MTIRKLGQAQKVKETTANMSQGEKNAFMLNTPDIDTKGTGIIWMDFMKPYKGKTQFNKKTGEWFTDNAKIPRMSDNTMDVYTIFQEKGKNTRGVMVWFDLGGAFLSSKDHRFCVTRSI